MSRYARRVDRSQTGIVAALRAAGCTVVSLAPLGRGAPDLAVGHGGVTFMLECKSPGYLKAHPERVSEQRAWAKAWRGGPVLFVSTPEQALDALGLRAKPADTGASRFYPHR